MNIPIPWVDCFVNALHERPYGNIWTDGEEILVKTESAANAIADLIEMLYMSEDKDVIVCIGYYDSDEDKEDNTTDEYTGWWYVRIN